jgi:hypothetical protein
MNHSTHQDVIPEVMTYQGSPLPPFPPITSLMSQLPQQSDPIIISTSSDRLALWANSDNSSRMFYVADVPGTVLKTSPSVLRNYWGDGPPRTYQLTLRRYWRQVPGTYTLVQPGGSFSKQYTTTHGTSTTDTQTLSAELDVGTSDLGAKISASFSHSVTIEDQQSEQTTFGAGAPAQGFQRVWIIWQLVEELVALTPDGKVLAPSDGREGDIFWINGFPFGGCSGAYLSYNNVQQPFPTQIYMPQQKDFADA